MREERAKRKGDELLDPKALRAKLTLLLVFLYLGIFTWGCIASEQSELAIATSTLRIYPSTPTPIDTQTSSATATSTNTFTPNPSSTATSTSEPSLTLTQTFELYNREGT